MRWKPAGAAFLAGVIVTSCGRGPMMPEALELGREACAYCRMTVSDPHFASQVLAPGELPKFFDDLGCLNHFLTGTTDVPAGSVIYVTDHRSNEWVRAESAVFARVPARATPMSSHLVAHASVESRAADPTAAGGSPVAMAAVVPLAWQPGGGQR